MNWLLFLIKYVLLNKRVLTLTVKTLSPDVTFANRDLLDYFHCYVKLNGEEKSDSKCIAVRYLGVKKFQND